METESCRVHPSMWRSNPLLFLLCLVLILAYGAGLVLLLVWWVKSQKTTLIVTDKRTILKTGILSKHTNEVLHEHIHNIQITQNLMERIFDIGTIKIASPATGGIEISASGIPAPNRIKSIIDHYRL